ncbi:MAG: hypothetical protein U0796_09485 [Gemmatales bacterium]
MTNATYEEAIYMVRIKRKRAKEVIAKIITRYGSISNEPALGLEVLIDYFVNMVYGLELLLKILSDDWKGPKRTRFGHRVGEMYKEVFQREHAKHEFIAELEDAILNQKFLCEPATGLIDRVADIESLWDELVLEYRLRSRDKVNKVEIDIRANADFGMYLAQNPGRFIDPATNTLDASTKEDKIQWKRMQVRHLECEIEMLSVDEPTQLSHEELLLQLEQEYRATLSNLSQNMIHNFQLWGTSELRFSIGRMMMAEVDLDT